ncbi:hypothetical protein OGATHE_005811 [Ogataea polymorpha]|uniref:Uncharacterized protein n=1 Tax=Ogataea polymorpha TaxID=460523 RepID=A0A9P8SZQ6_9ASCO|nr:hypothetical protein OGATHE_005811 [Ogataea polymorpha]
MIPMMPITAKLKKESCWPSLPIAFCSGVLGFSIDDSIECTPPRAVLWPVAMTIPDPWPSLTSVPMNAMLVLSPMLGIGLVTTSRFLEIGFVSPVRLLSSMVRWTASVSLTSAGIRSPTWKCTRSPGTSVEAITVSVVPFLVRCANSGTSLFRASKLFSERYSWTKPTVTTISTAAVILMASSKLPM